MTFRFSSHFPIIHKNGNIFTLRVFSTFGVIPEDRYPEVKYQVEGYKRF